MQSVPKNIRGISILPTIRKIISGGQTGVDRAALDAAIATGIPHGGWVPKGRKAEDGIIPSKYNLIELDDEEYAARTLRNVQDSDGILIITSGSPDYKRPFLIIDLQKSGSLKSTRKILSWLSSNSIEVLNVAGPRESKNPGIYKQALQLLVIAFEHMKKGHGL